MELAAPSHWKTVDFLSDIHLDAGERETFELWRAYLENTHADAVFILGDLFEVWVGDDALDQHHPFEQACVTALRSAGERLNLFIMTGNRDFLMGSALMKNCGAQALPDPTVLIFNGQRFVLSHGDALCTGDTEYQAFRKLVRSPQWQHTFLSKPLTERQAIAREIRSKSETKKSSGDWYADVDATAALDLLRTHDSTTLIHGHTHRPGQVHLGNGHTRWVLSDWVVNATPPRADVLRLTANGVSATHLTRLQGTAVTTAQR